MKYIILGAGLSGLSCAASLRKYGHDVWVVEKEPEAGGLARSYRENGFVFDYGPHFLFGPKIFDLVQKEFPSMKLNEIASTKEKMYFHQKYFRFPFDPKNILLNMDRPEIPAVLWELIIKRLFDSAGTRQFSNVEEWVVQAVGKHIYDYISLGGYIEKLYGLPASDISYEWGMQKLTFLAKWRDAGLLKLALRSFTEKSQIKKRVIYYPPTGIDHLAGEILRSFQSAGGKVLFNTEALSVVHQSDGIAVSIQDKDTRATLTGDFLVSTIPITHLVPMIMPRIPAAVQSQVDHLRYRTLLLLYIFINRDFVLKDQCVYFTEPHYLFRRITEFKHMESSMAPKGKTSLCVEMTYFDDDAWFQKDQSDIFRLVLAQLEDGGYVEKGDIEGYRFLRVPFAYPVYEIASGTILEQVLDCLQNYANMITIGRQGLFFYNAMNSSILMGSELGDKLGQSDRSGWPAVVRETYTMRLGKYN